MNVYDANKMLKNYLFIKILEACVKFENDAFKNISNQ